MKQSVLFSCALIFALTSCSDSYLSEDLKDNKKEIDATTVDFSYSIKDRNVTFTSVSDSKVKTFVWDFGDGTAFGKGKTTTHTYAKDGTYTVILGGYWDYKGQTVKKYSEKKITVKGSSGSGTENTPSWKEAYITGFRVYKIPDNNYYYKIEFNYASLAGNKMIETAKKELFKTDLPYDFVLSSPFLMPGGENAFELCSLMDMYVYKSYYSWQSDTQCLHQTKELEFGDIKGEKEYVFTSSKGETQVSVLFKYK